MSSDFHQGIADRQISSIFDRVIGTCLYFNFWMIMLLNFNGFSPNLVCALILWTSASGLLMVEFRLFLTSAHNTSVFYFQDNNLSNSPWIFTKFDVCIDIVEIASCFRIAH